MKRNRELNQEKNQAIVEAAVREFERAGYNSANMDRVAKEANVSKATVYKHFGSKKELFLSLMWQFKEVMDEHHTIEYDPKKTIHEQLLEFGNKKLEFINNPEYMVMMKIGMVTMMQECDVQSELQGMVTDHLFDNLIQWFEDAKKDNKLTFDDAVFVSNLFIGLIKSQLFFPPLIFGTPMPSNQEQQKVIKSAVETIICQYGK